MKTRTAMTGRDFGETSVKVVWQVWLAFALSARGAELPGPSPLPESVRQLREYGDFAMGHDGNPARGRELFHNEQRAGCVKCHSVDGRGGKAGPDLFAVGDKFPRRELIRAVLEPSAEIAVGYGYASGQEALAHFGLGTLEKCDLEVILPHGKGRLTRKGVKANQLLTLTQ